MKEQKQKPTTLSLSKETKSILEQMSSSQYRPMTKIVEMLIMKEAEISRKKEDEAQEAARREREINERLEAQRVKDEEKAKIALAKAEQKRISDLANAEEEKQRAIAEEQAKELVARETSDYILYVITPRMTGVYSVAEVVDDSNKRPEKTLFCVIWDDKSYDIQFTPHQVKSLEATIKMVAKNGARTFKDLDEVATFLNVYAV